MSELNVEVEKGKSYKVESIANEQFAINGVAKEVDIIQLKGDKFHLIKDNKSYTAEVLSANYEEKSFEIRVNNNVYHLNVEDRFDLLLQELGMEDLAAAGVTELKAPMPGLVLSIDVKVGQSIKANETLVVLEAMKMENVLKAPTDVTIKSIEVEQGQAVEKNQLLIEFEAF